MQNLPEQSPVHPCLWLARPAHEHNRANQAVCCANRHANLGGQQNCECSAKLYCEPSGSQTYELHLTCMEYQHQLGQETEDLPVSGAEVQWAHAPCCFITKCTMLLNYAHVPCCFIMHMPHAASLHTCIRKRNPVISVTHELNINPLHTTQKAT